MEIRRKNMIIPQVKKILYATDLSKNSSYAFLYAIDMARKLDARITILHAVQPISSNIRAQLDGYEDLVDKAKHQEQDEDIQFIKKHLEKLCKKVETQVGTPCVALVSDILVPLGHPVEEILKAADEKKCDLIILGTHGKGFLQQTFLGSVARSVLDRTRKPVYIVPLPSEKNAADLDGI
jgi:nucleotide-binding universal stress UspA family protein